MHYADPITGQWQESQEKFDLTRDGYAIARSGPAQVIVSPVANDSAGTVDYLASDGRRFRSTLLGISISDRVTGTNLMLAEVTNSIGKQIAPNEVLFPDCFAGLSADVRLTYLKGEFHQDVILKQALDLQSLIDLGFDKWQERDC